MAKLFGRLPSGQEAVLPACVQVLPPSATRLDLLHTPASMQMHQLCLQTMSDPVHCMTEKYYHFLHVATVQCCFSCMLCLCKIPETPDADVQVPTPAATLNLICKPSCTFGAKHPMYQCGFCRVTSCFMWPQATPPYSHPVAVCAAGRPHWQGLCRAVCQSAPCSQCSHPGAAGVPGRCPRAGALRHTPARRHPADAHCAV